MVVESWGVRKWVRDRVKEGYERKNLNPMGAGLLLVTPEDM